MPHLTDTPVDAPDASESITASVVSSFHAGEVIVGRDDVRLLEPNVTITAGNTTLYVPPAEAFTLAAAIVTQALVLLRSTETRP